MLLRYLTIGNISLTALWLITLAILLVLYVKYRQIQSNQAAPVATVQQQAQPTQTEPQKMGLNLNMLIANSHQFTTQLIGMQLSSANALALAVSATSVVAGTVSVAVIFYPGGYPLWLVAGAVGAGLAVLIEGLTLGALIRIRLANKVIKDIDEKIDQERDERFARIVAPVPGADVKEYKERVKAYQQAVHLVEGEIRRKRKNATYQYTRKRTTSCVIAFFGAVASATAGGLFYHTLLANLAWYASYGISALFALVVTGTFISSELFKDEQQQAIREGFEGGALAETAIKQETIRLAHQGVYLESVQFLQSSEAHQMIRAGFKEVLKDVIAEMRVQTDEQIVAAVFEEKDQASINTNSQQTPQLSAPVSVPQNSTISTQISQQTIEDSAEDSVDEIETTEKVYPVIEDEDDDTDLFEDDDLSDEEHTTDPLPVVTLEDEKSDDENDANNITFLHSKNATNNETNVRHKAARGERAKKAATIMKRNPNITPPELSKKAGISQTYARQLLAKQQTV